MARPLSTPSVTSASARGGRQDLGSPFFGVLDPVLVDDAADDVFAGAISRAHARVIWTWIVRELAPDLIDPGAWSDAPAARAALQALVPELYERARPLLEVTHPGAAAQRLAMALGSDLVRARLPSVFNALRHRALIEKAMGFGRTLNAIQDEAALVSALQSVPFNDRAVAPLLMMAAIGEIETPSRLVAAALTLVGNAREASITRAGFGPLVEAILAHARNAMPPAHDMAIFSDYDLTCRRIERFHQLLRALNGYIEFSRGSRWTQTIAGMVKLASSRIEPGLRNLVSDINRALRRPGDRADRLDADALLTALNGVYLLMAVRACRDSLALNALFDLTWTRSGEILELHLQRNLDFFRANPDHEIVAARLDMAITMAELRFGAEYADVLRRARGGAERAIASSA